MTTLPVREIVLYKHGVGYFVREGDISGNAITLNFRQDEINDVLKSLAVFDRAGGQILGIHYQTPMDIGARLANSSINLSDTDSLRGLIRDLRGRLCTIVIATAADNERQITGRVIGIDEPNPIRPLDTDSAQETRLAILDTQEQIHVYYLADLQSISISDPQSKHDLSYFLDTSMTEESQSTVHIRLNEGNHELVVNYVIPSPTWRVSYRIVAETNEDVETGKAFLQGWGLFDNRLEEDLDNVRVTLVAGQPISFIYDLFTSRIPERPTVQDESRIAPGPVAFGGAVDAIEMQDARMERLIGLEAPRFFAGSTETPPGSAPKSTPATRQQMASAAAVSTESKDVGEFFQYIVTTPVSVKRGESALVPIIGSDLEYHRELLYNGQKLPDHPVAALRFMNTSGLTLERGPITVVEDGDYKGEAVVPFTKHKNEVYLPYAVELGVRIVERHDHRTETNKLSFDQGGYLVYEERHIQATTYVIENTTLKELSIYIESPIRPNYSIFDMPDPDVETATERRWKITAPAHQKTEFVRSERTLSHRQQQIRSLSYQNLQVFMENRWLDKSTIAELRQIIDNLALIEQSTQTINNLKAERENVYSQQEQLRANLTTLQSDGDEGKLRKRMLDQLEKTQDRLDAIENEINDLTTQWQAADQQVKAEIAALGENS